MNVAYHFIVIKAVYLSNIHVHNYLQRLNEGCRTTRHQSVTNKVQAVRKKNFATNVTQFSTSARCFFFAAT